MFLQTALAAALTLCQPYYDAKLALHGYRSCDGRVAAAPQYTVAEPFGKGGIAAVVDAQGWAYINRRGEVVIRPFIFDNGPDGFSDGLARYTEGGKFGFFNTSGAVVIPARFEFAYPFVKGRAKVGEGCTSVSDGEHTRIDCRSWRFIQKPPQRAHQRAKDA
jgi:hypothetical protein